MKALSVRQPWASLIASGAKTIETRTWPTRYRGPLLIVSSRHPAIAPAGQALATVRLVDCRPWREGDRQAACCLGDESTFSWVLDDVRAIEPFPVRGRLGLYEVELPVRAQVEMLRAHEEAERIAARIEAVFCGLPAGATLKLGDPADGP